MQGNIFSPMRDMRFSQRVWWRFLSCRMSGSAVGRTARDCFVLKINSLRFLRNVWNYLPS